MRARPDPRRLPPDLLHQHPRRRDLAGHPREPRVRTCPRSSARCRPRRPMGVGLRLSGIAADGASRAEALDELAGVPRARRTLRLHDQRLPLRPLPRHPGQGGGLPARLDDAGAAALHKSASPTSWPRSCRRAWRAASAPCPAPSSRWRPLRTRPSAWPRQWSAMPRTWSAIERRTGRADRARARARALLLPRDDRGDGRLLRATISCSPRRASCCAGLRAWTTREADAALRRHLGVCYDVCHAAVEFEDPAGSLAALAEAGIRSHQAAALVRAPSA